MVEADYKLFVATKAFLVNEGAVLIIRESSGYEDGTNANKFDIVGGRINPGTPTRKNLEREIEEETGFSLEVPLDLQPFAMDEWYPKPKDVPFHIVGMFFKLPAPSREVRLSNDHLEYQWIDPRSHQEYPMIESMHRIFDIYIAQLDK